MIYETSHFACCISLWSFLNVKLDDNILIILSFTGMLILPYGMTPMSNCLKFNECEVEILLQVLCILGFWKECVVLWENWLRLICIDITKHTYLWSQMVVKVIMWIKCGLIVGLRTVPVSHDALSVHCTGLSLNQWLFKVLRTLGTIFIKLVRDFLYQWLYVTQKLTSVKYRC